MAKPIKHQEITLRDGTAAVLSMAQLSATLFEVMLASPDYDGFVILDKQRRRVVFISGDFPVWQLSI